MKVSILVPFHFVPNWEPLFERCMKSIEMQTFQDYEIILLKRDRAAKTQNDLMRMAKGELIKILHMDDFFSYPNSLEVIVNNFLERYNWLATDCLHSVNLEEASLESLHEASYAQDIHTGNNTIGAPSVITFRNDLGVFFDEDLDWLYDVSLYKKLHDRCGAPYILHSPLVTIGLHSGQLTHQIPEDIKRKEVALMAKRYA